MRNDRRDEKGITLIALVITIIVLLILAGVTIATLTGDNGILNQATNAKEETTKSEEEEKIKMAVMASSVNDDGLVEVLDEGSFKNELKNQFGNQELDIIVNGDGSFIITIKNTKRKYYVNDDKTVINSDNIIEINDKEELKAFRDDVNKGNSYEGKAVLLTDDITVDSNEEWKPIGYYPMTNSTPEAETNKPFRGIFDGSNCEINGLYINTTDKAQGFFGLVNGGTIRNIQIGEKNNITGGISTGAVAGYLYNGSKGVNCYNKADIRVGSFSGGLFGQVNLNGIIENCYNEGDITSNNATTLIGGIVGSLVNNSQINKCYNTGDINCTGTENIGGITGQLQKNHSTIDNCYNLGNISGKNSIGGIVGQTYNNVLLQNCYNIGNVNGDYRIGGIAGMNSAEIYNCYNIGNISGNTEYGGIVGLNTISETSETVNFIKNVYSLENIYGVNNGTIEQSGVKTSEELKLLASTLGNAFEESNNGINDGFPILKWQIE